MSEWEGVVMDEKTRSVYVQTLRDFAFLLERGEIDSIFAICFLEGKAQTLAYVVPERREPLIAALNDELTRMLGGQHHIVSTDKLGKFLKECGISEDDLIAFDLREALGRMY